MNIHQSCLIVIFDVPWRMVYLAGMNVEELQEICSKFPGVTEDIKWDNDLCFCIGGKMFLIVGLEQSPVTASFKTSDEEFEELSQRSGNKPAPYLAKNKWVYVEDINLMSKKEWKERAAQAYHIILEKLPKKFQASLKN